MPTVTLREARQRPQQQRASPSFVDDAVRSWDNFISRRSNQTSTSSSTTTDNYGAPGGQQRQRSFYRLLPSGSNRSCVPNASYSPTLGLTIGSINVDYY
mmetsp:Transcript_9522/g.7941  ORF Transcript_9522/g.7941 Transcript_9522/m.7941 type:complete len:99 (-) Transcript_9522:5-301(-)